MVTPFQIPYDPNQIEDLRSRLANTRWADSVMDDWSMGTERTFLRQLTGFWYEQYDWGQRLEHLNQLPHFRASIDGYDLHFLHFQSENAKSVPLLLMNGWPSSFIEFERLGPLLTRGSPAFDVIVPTVPGYGYSGKPARPYEADPVELFPKLMAMLGYQQFVVAGTDIGSGIATRIALLHPARVLAVHVSSVAAKPFSDEGPPLTDAERAYDARLQRWNRDEGGYQAIQSSRPQTLAFALADSPVGLASWIVEKFRAWTDCSGDVFSIWPIETLIDTLMIYWTTNTIDSSMRYYYEASKLRPPLQVDDFVAAPTAVAMWPHDLALAPRESAERLYNVHSYTVFERGGHFPAWEAPELYADDLRGIASAAVAD